jgi:GT2 family glycosyltransferase
VDPDNLYSLIACGTLFRTELLRAIGGYRAFYWEEYDLYLRLRTQGRFLHVAAPLYTYRRHAAGMTGSRRARHEGWRQLAQIWGAQALREAGVNPELEEALR